MKRLLRLVALALAGLVISFAPAQVPVTPIIQPHMTFNNLNGSACAGCSLYSYAAGSTTPQATYTDSTGTTPNTNPVILGVDGGPLTPSGSSGAIWLGQNAYKLVLVDTTGTTVFTVDNVAGGGLFPCGPANSIQIANSAVTGLSCDAAITINPSLHAINVGTLPAAYVTIGALGTPTTWTFDTTSPATALASLGGTGTNSGTLNQLAYYAATGNVLSGTNAIPNGITATTQTPSDNSMKLATTAYVASPGVINPTSVQIVTGTAMTANQGTGAAVQHSTGSTVSGDLVKYDANGNTVDAGITPVPVQTIFWTGGSGSGRALATWYQNTSSVNLDVRVSLRCGGDCNFAIDTSSTNSGGQEIVQGFGTGSGETGFIAAVILPGKWYYVGGDPSFIWDWTETTLP